MEITVSQVQGRVAITVIKVSGQLDGQTYSQLIEMAHKAYDGGARDFLLDFSDLTYISSAGLVSLHSIALLTRGESLPDPQQGWSTLKSMDRTRDGGMQQHVKLFNPQPAVINVLDMVGFSTFFEVFTDQQKAIQSF